MPDPLFKGGILSVEFSTDLPFTAPIVVTGADKFSKEGQTWPSPDTVEELTDQLSDNKNQLTGYVLPFVVRIKQMAAADVTTLQTAADDGTDYWVRFTSLDGRTVLILLKLKIRCKHGAIVEFGKFGGVVVSGEASGIKAADAYTLTWT